MADLAVQPMLQELQQSCAGASLQGVRPFPTAPLQRRRPTPLGQQEQGGRGRGNGRTVAKGT